MENYTVNEMMSLSWGMLKEEWKQRGPTKDFLHTFMEEFSAVHQLRSQEVMIMFAIAFLFTIHRYVVTFCLLKPLAKFMQFSTKDETKFIESVSRLFWYWVFFVMEYYLVAVKYPEIRNDPTSHWADWKYDMTIPEDIRYLYLMEAGFYFHGLYATMFMDIWKKDSIPMMVHHVLANSLIIFSMATRYHRIGLIVLYLHDSADVILESTKFFLCIKSKFNYFILEIITGVGFISFAANWAWCRLIVYPQIVLFSSLYMARKQLGLDGKFYFLFNGMLTFLLVLNVYWFHFIVMLMLRIVTGQSKGVEDIREHENKNGIHKNGVKTSQENGHATGHKKVN